MKKKLLVGVALLAMLVGCGQQPELDVNADADQNKTTQEQNQTAPQVEENVTMPQEEDVNNTAVIDVTDESENINKNQKIAAILIKNIVHFDFDKYNLKDSEMSIVNNVANTLKDVNGSYTIRVEGNCDEWGSDEYNYALGLKRAKEVKSALIDLGIDENRLTIISYGESNPVCTAHNRECWAKNRRDNFTLLP